MITGQNTQGAVTISTKSVIASTKKEIFGELSCTNRVVGSKVS